MKATRAATRHFFACDKTTNHTVLRYPTLRKTEKCQKKMYQPLHTNFTLPNETYYTNPIA